MCSVSSAFFCMTMSRDDTAVVSEVGECDFMLVEKFGQPNQSKGGQ